MAPPLYALPGAVLAPVHPPTEGATLASAPPIIDQSFLAWGANGAPQATGTLYAGTVLPAPIPVTPTCTTWLDVQALIPLRGFQAGPAGGFLASVAVAPEPALHGVELGLQAALAAAGGVALTSAIRLTIAH